jgi:hypothetical protein
VKLNHLDLQVDDVQTLASFLALHFELVRRSNDRSPAIAILGDDAGFTLVIQRRREGTYPPGFHIGFILDTAAEVHARRDTLVASGVTVGEIGVDNRGTRFYLTAPGEILVEVSSPAT